MPSSNLFYWHYAELICCLVGLFHKIIITPWEFETRPESDLISFLLGSVIKLILIAFRAFGCFDRAS